MAVINCEYCGLDYDPLELPSGIHICQHCVSCHISDEYYQDMCCAGLHKEVEV